MIMIMIENDEQPLRIWGKVVFLFGPAQFKKSGVSRLQKAENIRFGERMFSILTCLIESIIQFCCFFSRLIELGRPLINIAESKKTDFYWIFFLFHSTFLCHTNNDG